MNDWLTPGVTYRVTYRRDGARRLREMVARFLERQEPRRLVFDLRPLAGTTELDSRDVVAATRDPDQTYRMLPRIAAGEGVTR